MRRLRLAERNEITLEALKSMPKYELFTVRSGGYSRYNSQRTITELKLHSYVASAAFFADSRVQG